MNSFLLPDPIDFSEKLDQDFSTIVDYVYENHFKSAFMNKHTRPLLKNKFIYFPLEWVNYKPERFWHLISFEAKDGRFTADPCNNTIEMHHCNILKSKCGSMAILPNHLNLIDRCECLYRLSRIIWLSPIIELANVDHPNIQIWEVEKRDVNGSLFTKTLIRFLEGYCDYLIVLVNSKNGSVDSYKFITAYPVVLKNTKNNLTSSYLQYLTK